MDVEGLEIRDRVISGRLRWAHLDLNLRTSTDGPGSSAFSGAFGVSSEAEGFEVRGRRMAVEGLETRDRLDLGSPTVGPPGFEPTHLDRRARQLSL